MTLSLSALDLLPVAAGSAPAQAIRDCVAFARSVESLGYTRYWVAEHHGMPSIASSAPEVIIAHVASATSRIRVGAGGIMIPNHSPLRVVEIFRTLAALHPDRIDLGLGRAPGTDPVTASALQRRGPQAVNEMLAEILAFDRGEFPPGHPFARIIPMPSDVALPPIWMLGSTLAGASIGASLGVRYAFAGHFAMKHARAALETYRSRFVPSKELARPYAMLAVTVVCGEDDEHAARLAAPLRLAIVKTATGRFEPIASVEEALAYPYSPQERAFADDFLAGAIIGGPARIGAELPRLAQELGADEIMVSALIPSLEERTRSFERIAKAISLC